MKAGLAFKFVLAKIELSLPSISQSLIDIVHASDDL